ncbi:MAG: hypothetical protein WD827_00570 [Solirubrobacterales bacterium]
MSDPAAPQTEAAIGDSNDLFGHHFKQLLGSKKAWLWGGIPTVVVAIGLAFGNPIWIPIVLVLGLLILLVVCALIAVSRAKNDFWEAYAQQRGMTLISERGRLPEATPLLSKGDDRYTERILEGPLAEGFEGRLALYTYEEETTDSKGNRQTSYSHYTVCLLDIPECGQFVPQLYCQRKFGLRALEKFEDVFRGSKDRVKFESEALHDKYEIFAHESQDQNWLRQLFSPTFIVWLTDSTPKKFAFELVDGTLCCYVGNHQEKAADLDAVRLASTAVGARLREESLE